jgi:two-component system KDP operon response regulator KdpE
MNRLLLVEDDPRMSRALALSLAARGYDVTPVAEGATAQAEVQRRAFDLVVLDLGLPDIDGIEVLRTLRTASAVPVIVLSARRDRAEKIRALDSGADDYVTKPFDLEELLARLRAAVRRAAPNVGAPTIVTPHFTVDLARKRVERSDGSEVHLTPTEWQLLEALVRRPGVVVDSPELLREVWGPRYERETNYLRVYVAQLRKKLEPEPQAPRYLLTTPGIGYRFDPGTP